MSKCISCNHRRISERGRGDRGPPFFLYFQNVLRFCFENRFIKCSLILSSETLTLLYSASQIRLQCCMLHVIKSEVSTREGGKVWDSDPSFWIFWVRPWQRLLVLGFDVKLFASTAIEQWPSYTVTMNLKISLNSVYVCTAVSVDINHDAAGKC